MVQIKSSKPVSPKTLDLALMSFDKLQSHSELGFLDLPYRDEVWDRANATAYKLRCQTNHLVVCGMGGSSLGGRALVQSLGYRDGVSFLLDTDPESLNLFFEDTKKLRHSHFLVVSKSGNTLEIAVFLSMIMKYLKSAGLSVSQNVTVVTEAKSSPLYEWAVSEDVQIIPHPLDVGGRFSAFSEVGLIPAAFSGVQLEDLRHGVLTMRESSVVVSELTALYLESFEGAESISVFWSYIGQFHMMLPWLSQLWAESLGQKSTRDGKPAPRVSTPLAASGTCDQHSILQQFIDGAHDKFVLFLRSKEHLSYRPKLDTPLETFRYLNGKSLGEVYTAQSMATEEALRAAGVETASLSVERSDAFALGQLMMLFELVIGTLGEALDVNVFVQPGVELGKKITKAKLEGRTGV